MAMKGSGQHCVVHQGGGQLDAGGAAGGKGAGHH